MRLSKIPNVFIIGLSLRRVSPTLVKGCKQISLSKFKLSGGKEIFPFHWRGNKKGKPFFLACLFFLFSLNLLTAQNSRDSTIFEIGEKLLRLIESNMEDRHSSSYGNDTAALNQLYNLTDPKFQLAGKALINAYRAEQVRMDKGIDLKMNYFLNSDSFLDNDQEDAEGDFIDNRARIGLQWELMKGGLLGNRHKYKRLQAIQNVEALKYDLEINDERLFLRKNIIIFMFNESKIKLLKESQTQVQQELELLYKVYFLKGILYEEILKAKSKMDQIKVQLENYESYNQWILKSLDIPEIKERFKNEDLPVFEVNLDYVMNDVQGKMLADSLRRLEENIQRFTNRAVDEVSLKLHVNQFLGGNDGFSLQERNYISTGVTLSVPTEIMFDGRIRKRLKEQQIKERVDFSHYKHINEKSEIINFYYEYNYKLKTFMEFLYKEMLYQERIRMEIVNHQDFTDIHRSLRILRLMADMRSIRLEMIDLKQRMYLLLLKIYGNTHYRSVIPVIKQIDVAAYYQRLPASRTIVMDEAALNQYDQNFIVNYLLSNGAERIVFGNYTAGGKKKAKGLQDQLDGSGIKSYKAIHGTQIWNSAEAGAQNVAKELMLNQHDGVLLDFTNLPKGGKERAQNYLASNLDLLYKEDGAVSVQIDKGYPRELIATLAQATGRISLKLKSQGDLEYLRLVANIPATTNKLSVLIEAKKFKDRIELEAYIDMIHGVYNINHVTILGFMDYMSLDNKTLVDME
ncbi:MAG: hypothetical protein ACI8YQ_000514 [Polaribacter sp.]|jgi:hypothetical protein